MSVVSPIEDILNSVPEPVQVKPLKFKSPKPVHKRSTLDLLAVPVPVPIPVAEKEVPTLLFTAPIRVKSVVPTLTIV